MIRILIVDDDPSVRLGLSMVLGADREIEIVGEAINGVEALEAARLLTPDLVLMDIRMPVMDGLTALDALRSEAEGPAVIILTTFDTDEHILRALRLGAHGFLLKDTPPLEILSAVHRVVAGESMLSPTVITRLIDHLVREAKPDERTSTITAARVSLDRLSAREYEVARAVADGATNAEISAELFMSVATVKAYVSRILVKLGCTNRVQIAITVHQAHS